MTKADNKYSQHKNTRKSLSGTFFKLRFAFVGQEHAYTLNEDSNIKK